MVEFEIGIGGVRCEAEIAKHSRVEYAASCLAVGCVKIDAFFDLISASLVDGTDVKISGFGNFQLRDKPQRPGRNPKTGEEIPITARRVVTFHASQKLKVMVEAANHAGSQPS